jgi:hypothetical protein
MALRNAVGWQVARPVIHGYDIDDVDVWPIDDSIVSLNLLAIDLAIIFGDDAAKEWKSLQAVNTFQISAERGDSPQRASRARYIAQLHPDRPVLADPKLLEPCLHLLFGLGVRYSLSGFEALLSRLDFF